MSAIRALRVTTDAEERSLGLNEARVALATVSGPSALATRLLAQEVDSTSGTPANLAAIWQLLLDGRRVILDCFYSPTRWFAVCFAPRADESWKSVSPRVRRLFDTLLLGERQKNAAFEYGVCTSTISLTVQRGLEQLGIALTPCKAPPILTLLARAGRGLGNPGGRLCSLELGGRHFEVLSVERPELRLAATLPPAEFHVLCRLVEGATYQEISSERGTARRTIANQVRSVFQRLKVSSRGELITRLLELAASSRSPEPPANDLNALRPEAACNRL